MKRFVSNILFLFIASIVVAQASPTTGPATLPRTAPSTQPAGVVSIVIRDTDARQATTRAVTDGGSVVQSVLPPHWTLQFNLNCSPGSVLFTIDGAMPHVENYSPWVVAGDNVPIDLPIGDHVITYAIDSGSPAIFHFSVLPGAALGTNLEGISYSQGDPEAHPQLLATANDLHVQFARFWLEGAWTGKLPGDYFHVTRAWQKAGVKVIAVANFQNSQPRCSAPGDAVWTAYWSAFPASAQTGIYAIDLGNEVNTSMYYTGTPEQLAHLMALAYPILHAKGYVVCAPSILDSLGWYQQLAKVGAFSSCDRIDMHSYASTAASVISYIDKGIGFGRSLNPAKPCDSSEWGVRMSVHNKPAWAAETAKALSLLQSRPGWFCAFSFYPTGDPLDQATPLDAVYNPNEPFHSAIRAAVQGGGK